MSDLQQGYTVYIIRDGEQISIGVRTKRDAEREYRKLAADWLPEDGYEVALYRGVDVEMLASTWPAI